MIIPNCREAKGVVILQFEINEKGRPFNITVKDKLCPDADKEAIRLLQDGPDWTIGSKLNILEVTF